METTTVSVPSSISSVVPKKLSEFDWIVKWVNNLSIDLAAQHGHLNTVKFLYRSSESMTTYAMDKAAQNGHFEIVKFLYGVGAPYNMAPYCASKNGHIDIVKFFYEKGYRYSASEMDVAAEYGHLAVVEYLTTIGDMCTTYAMDLASSNGHLHVVKFLHKIGAKCTHAAMDFAAEKGYFDIVKYLNEHRTIECGGGVALYRAARNGHFNIVKYLNENILLSNEVVKLAVEGAAEAGNLDIVKYLLTNYAMDAVPSTTMDHAAGNGHLEVLKFLHEKCGGICTKLGLEQAIEHKHMDCAEYIYQTMICNL